jgi:hypothetical protein
LKIYFDGALPLHKRDTRLSRLEKSRKQLETFCRATSRESGLISVERGLVAIRPRDLFQGFESSGKRPKLPENAFMVSAVIEDLVSRWNISEIKSNLLGNLANLYIYDTDHPWSDICEVVPGEADIACAALAYREPGLAILTSDSDLLVYDFGSSSSVIFFNTFSTESWYDEDPSQSTVRAMSISPGSVSRRLGIPALSYFAYELSLDPHAGFRELIRRAKHASAESSQPVPAAYTEFMRQYDFQCFQNGSLDPSLLSGIDVRLSELLVQCLWASEYLEETPRIYLPFLQEDHSRRCGWAEGSRIRRLAFSLLNFNPTGVVKYSTITECTRRGTRFCFDQVALYTHEIIDLEARRLLDIFHHAQTANPQEDDSPIFWRIFAIAEMHLNATDTLPPRLDKQALASFLGFGKTKKINNSSSSVVGWEEIHALAQTQSVLYSLRILSQIITTVPHSQGLVGQLHAILSTLPPLHVLMRSYREVRDEFYNV